LGQILVVLGSVFDNPWGRTLALIFIILATIWFIVVVYRGNTQSATHGPLA
jgi:hypothetical protein